jgi:FKBP-type peptidyl-prolyl cis-trans isomerase 2
MIEKGNKITVHYKGFFDNNEVFDSSYERGEPLGFSAGTGMMIAGFDAAVIGMKIGDKKTIKIEAKDAYGEVDPNQLFEVPLDQLPEGVSAGMQLMAQDPDGNQQQLTVVSIGATTATLDSNHAMAGKTLNFDIEIVSIA